MWPCNSQPLHKHMQPTLFKNLLPWCRPLTPLGPEQPSLRPLDSVPSTLGQYSPGASGAWTWRNESFSILSQIKGNINHWVQILPGPPFQEEQRGKAFYSFSDSVQQENMAWLVFCLGTLALQSSLESQLCKLLTSLD